jgi:hypothetical protein
MGTCGHSSARNAARSSQRRLDGSSRNDPSSKLNVRGFSILSAPSHVPELSITAQPISVWYSVKRRRADMIPMTKHGLASSARNSALSLERVSEAARYRFGRLPMPSTPEGLLPSEGADGMQHQSAMAWLAPGRTADRSTRFICSSPESFSADIYQGPRLGRVCPPSADSSIALNVRRKLIAAQKYPFARQCEGKRYERHCNLIARESALV